VTNDFSKEKLPYYGFLTGLCMAVSGAVLIVEHYLMWGVLEFEPLGHETYGAGLLVIAIPLILNYLRNR
jgi:hypothetical protein